METNAHPCADHFGSKYLDTDVLVCQSQSDGAI